MEYNLKKDDYEDINSLISISSQIKDLYNELYKLELSGKKLSEEYISVIKRLKTTLFVENNIYERIGLSYEKNSAILRYLNENVKENQEFEQELFSFDADLIIPRITSRLTENVIKNCQELIPDELKELDFLKQHVTNSLNNSFDIRDSIIKDLINCLLAIIQKEHNKNPNISNYLKKLKYKVSYFQPKMEMNLLDNNFEIEENPYVESLLISQIYNWPKEIIDEIKQLYGVEYYKRELKTMLVYEDEDLKDDFIMSEMIIGQAFLRAIFLLLDDEIIMTLNDSFNDLINSEKLKPIFANRQEVIKMIINAYEKVKIDKSIPKIISLKL